MNRPSLNVPCLYFYTKVDLQLIVTTHDAKKIQCLACILFVVENRQNEL